MSLEHILEALAAEGQAEVSRIEQEAEEQARAILKQGEAEAIRIREEHIADIQPRIESERAHRINVARLAAQRVLLEARESLVDAAFHVACEQLAGVREGPTYPVVLKALMDEVFDELGPHVRLAVDPRDTGVVRGVLSQRGLDLDIEPSLETWGGVVGNSTDGRLTVDNTLETRLEQARRRLQGDVAAVFENPRTELGVSDAR